MRSFRMLDESVGGGEHSLSSSAFKSAHSSEGFSFCFFAVKLTKIMLKLQLCKNYSKGVFIPIWICKSLLRCLFKSHRIFWSFRGILRLFSQLNHVSCVPAPFQLPALVLLAIASIDAAIVELAERILCTAHMRRTRGCCRGRWRSIEHGGCAICDGGRGLLLI